MNSKETLEQVRNLLSRMWFHDQDGSTLYPVPARYWDSPTHFDWAKYSQARNSYEEIHNKEANESFLFEIIHNEVLPLIDKQLSNLTNNE